MLLLLLFVVSVGSCCLFGAVVVLCLCYDMLCLFIGYVVWLWAHWLAIRLAIRLSGWLFGLLAGGLFGRVCWSARGLLGCKYGRCRCDG